MDLYFFDQEGVYIGTSEARRSPLEPTVWLVPPNATKDVPPEIPEGSRARWDGLRWLVEPIPVPETGPETEPEQEPQPVTPVTVTPAQARIALLRGGWLDQVEAILAKPEHREASILWEYGTTVERDSPVLAAMAAELQLSEAEIDDLFQTARSL
ncbi:MAG: hypothetical protein ACPGOY_06890 [Rhodospirillaceae bacterium]